MHWSDDYLGADYDAQSYDCATFAVEVAQLHGFIVSLPSYALQRDNASALISEFKADYAEPVDHPIEGQPVLMISNGKPGHVGVCTKINNDWYVLHNIEKMGVIRQPLAAITEKIEGFYKWLA